MASEALGGAVDGGTPAATRQAHPPSWTNRLVDAVDRLPGPTWLALLGVTGLAIAWRSSVGWIGGWTPVGTFEPELLRFAVYAVFPFAMLYVLNHAAARAVRAFAPALEASPAELDHIEYELTTIPARSAAIVGLAGAAYAAFFWLADPEAEVAGVPLPALIVRAAGEWTYYAAWFVLIYQVVRQLRLVARLHQRATRLNLFDPAPLHAFSGLTVRAGIGFLFVAAWNLLTSPPEDLWGPANLASVASSIGVGAAAFILPLMGLHRRLVDEKDRLLAASSERLPLAIQRLHAAVDSGDLGRVEEVRGALAGLAQEREIVSKLGTWPWNPGTFAAFVSAIVLPIVLWLATRLLDRTL